MVTPDYIVGLVDGEGSFTAYVRSSDASVERVRRVRIEPRFYIKLIERDKPILDMLKRYFGCGNVYIQKDKRAHHQQCYRYEVANRNDLQKIIIQFFQKHTLRFPSKQKDFNLFCKLMRGIQRKDHLTISGLKKLYAIKQRMH